MNGGFYWEIPTGWRKITTIDSHTGGEPLRIVADGFLSIDGKPFLRNGGT